MLNESETDAEAPPPAGTLSPKQVLALKIAIGVMTVLLVLGLILLVSGMIYKTSAPSASPADAARQRQMAAPLPLLNIPLRAGSQVSNVMTDNGRLIVHLHGQSGDEVIVIDLASGWQQQRIVIAPPQPSPASQ